MDINQNELESTNKRNDIMSSEVMSDKGDNSPTSSRDGEFQRMESQYERERTESGNHSLIIIPDTPSPVFSKFKRRKQHYTGHCNVTEEVKDQGESCKNSCDKKHNKKLKKDLFYPHSQGRHHKDSTKHYKFYSKMLSPTKIKINPYIPQPISESPGFVSAQDIMKQQASHIQQDNKTSPSDPSNACNIQICPQNTEFKKPYREDSKESYLDRKSQYKLHSSNIKTPKHMSNHKIKHSFERKMGKFELASADGINHPCNMTRKRSLSNLTQDNVTETNKKKICVNHGKNVHNNDMKILNTVKLSPFASKTKKLDEVRGPMFSDSWPSESESDDSSDSDSESLREMIMGEMYQRNKVKHQETKVEKLAKPDKNKHSVHTNMSTSSLPNKSHMPSLGTSNFHQRIRKRNHEHFQQHSRKTPDTIHLRANTEGKSERRIQESPVYIDLSAASTPVSSRVGTTSPDATKLVEQVVEDEDYAKKLQEEMDMEYALSLQNLENQPPQPHSAGWTTPPHQYHTPVNAGSPALNRGHWAGPHSRTRFSGRQPDLEEMEAMLNAWSSPEDAVQVHRGSPSTAANRRSMRAARTSRNHNFFENLERINVDLSSVIRESSNALILRGSRRRGQRRNAVHADVFFQSPVAASGNDYEDLLNLAELLGDVKQKGLNDTQRSRLPERTFKANDDKDNKECMICMCEYDVGDNLKILPCFHEFHSGCIDKWIKGNATCPICRVEVKIS